MTIYTIPLLGITMRLNIFQKPKPMNRLTSFYIDLFIKAITARNLSPETIRWYRGILNEFEEQCPLLPNDATAIDIYLARLKCGDERRHGYYRALRAFYKFLNRRYSLPDLIQIVDPPRINPKEPSFLVPDELNKLLSYPHPPKIKAALGFLIDTGARLGELATLQIDNLNETQWGFTATISGKTGKRIVPISYETYHELMVELPFPWTTHRLGILISRACKTTGIKATAHTLRHTFGTLWEGEEEVLKRIMGHRHFSTTERYRHLRTEYIARQHARFSPLRMIYQTKSML